VGGEGRGATRAGRNPRRSIVTVILGIDASLQKKSYLGARTRTGARRLIPVEQGPP